MLTVGWTLLSERLPRGRKLTGGQRAGEDEALGLQEPALLEHVAQAVEVGPLVLRMVLTSEVVVGGQVDDRVDLVSIGMDIIADRLESVFVADVELVPAYVGVLGNTALGLRAQVDCDQLVLGFEQIEDAPSQKPRGTRDHDQRQ